MKKYLFLLLIIISSCSKEELDDLGSENPLIIAFGTLTFKILLRNFKRRYKIKKIPHYASHGSKEKYREVVKEILNS